ncbi:beta-ketoacyl synthase N-terminal-like domain-containing protein, partial [Mycobacteroides abscessus]
AIEAAPIAAFANMRIVMSTDNDNPAGASRPFDKNRTGFVFGEGGALMVIETEEHAKARGARIYARLLGAGITSDGFHVVAPHPDGIGAAKAMNRALETAGLDAKDIDHVNAHATATSVGDVAEGRAIHKSGLQHAAVYAPKGALGHSVGAVGAVEAVITVKSLQEGIIPPTLNYETPDPEIDLDIVSKEPRKGDYKYA